MADFAEMLSQDLGLWLQDQGIPIEFCEKFKGTSFEFVRVHADSGIGGERVYT